MGISIDIRIVHYVWANSIVCISYKVVIESIANNVHFIYNVTIVKKGRMKTIISV